MYSGSYSVHEMLNVQLRIHTQVQLLWGGSSLDQPVIFPLNSGRRVLKNRLFTNRTLRRIAGSGPFHPQSIHPWKSCWWKQCFHHHPHTAPPNCAGLSWKHRSKLLRWLTLEANSPQRQTLLPSRKDLTSPHCHLQTDIQTGNEEGSLHFQKLSYTVKN